MSDVIKFRRKHVRAWHPLTCKRLILLLNCNRAWHRREGIVYHNSVLNGALEPFEYGAAHLLSTTSQADRFDRSELVNLKLSKQDNRGVGQSFLFATSCEILLLVCR